MKRVLVISIILSLIAFSGIKAEDISNLDSLNNLLLHANQEDSIDIIIEIGEEYFINEDYSTSLNYFFTALKLSEAIGDISSSSDAANSIGRVYSCEPIERKVTLCM